MRIRQQLGGFLSVAIGLDEIADDLLLVSPSMHG